MSHPAVAALVADLARRDGVSDVWLHGSLATGDHWPGVSDIDVVAITTGAPDHEDVQDLVRLHRHLDRSWPGSSLGCTYVASSRLATGDATHTTWTHGLLVQRRLSAMVRAELLTHGTVLLGREPASVLAPMSADDMKDAAAQELAGYWSWAVRRPWLFLRPAHADLALMSMARARQTLSTGRLLTKSEALAHVRAPAHVVDGVRRRRTGETRARPVAPVLAHHAWHDTRRTIAARSARS